MKIAEGVHAVSYLAASGHTLSVVVDFNIGRVVAFGSDSKEWQPFTGTLLDSPAIPDSELHVFAREHLNAGRES